MAVTYTSPHHSREDPGGLIREALDLGAEFRGPAEDLLLGWSLRLPDDLSPALAARRLLERYRIDEMSLSEGPCQRLAALLRETATAQEIRPARRRGGWRSRRCQ